MIEPHLRRLITQILPRSPRTLVKKVLMFDEDQEDQTERVPSDKLDKRKTRSKCPWEERRKIAYQRILSTQRLYALIAAEECVPHVQQTTSSESLGN